MRWIGDAASLSAGITDLGAGPLGLDTEADSFHHYPEKTCLVQLSSGDRDLLIDPLSGTDLAPLGPLLADAGLRKILHGADYDLRLLQRDLGLRVRGLFDTMVAARLVGERAFGLAALLDKWLGVRVDKRFQRADWSLRPLPAAMCEYAAMDTRHLIGLAERLEARLGELGRAGWAEEEFRRLEQVRWSASESDPEAFLRIKHSSKLSRRELAVLRELVELRERIARERDRPPFKILGNALLLELARAEPDADADALRRVPGLPRGWTGQSRLELLRSAIGRGWSVPESELPRPRRRVRTRRDGRSEERLRRLCGRRDRLAEQLDLEPSVLGSRATLEQLLDAQDAGESPSAVPELRSWQVEILSPLLEQECPP